MSRWRTISNYREAPEAAGVYVLFSNGGAFYVEQSANLRKRLAHHLKPRFEAVRSNRQQPLTPFNRIARQCSIKIRPTSRYGENLMIEARMIKALRPVWNGGGR